MSWRIVGSRGGLGAWLATRLAPIAARLPVPAVHVETVRIRGGNLAACMAGEPIPRRVTNVDFTLRLGAGYRSLTMDVAGTPTSFCPHQPSAPPAPRGD